MSTQEARVREAMSLVGALMYAKLAPFDGANVASVAMQRQLESSSKAIHNYAYETACGDPPDHMTRHLKRQARTLNKLFMRCDGELPAEMRNRCGVIVDEVNKFAKTI